MPAAYKPDGYPSVSTYLIVTGAAAMINFMRQVFGAVELMRIPAEDGRIMHAAVRIDDAVIMIADGVGNFPSTPAHLHIYVPDVDDCYRKALAAGAVSLQEPVKKSDSDKRGGVRDAGGTTWWIATKVD